MTEITLQTILKDVDFIADLAKNININFNLQTSPPWLKIILIVSKDETHPIFTTLSRCEITITFHNYVRPMATTEITSLLMILERINAFLRSAEEF